MSSEGSLALAKVNRRDHQVRRRRYRRMRVSCLEIATEEGLPSVL